MAGVTDFRDATFARPLVEKCGRYLGHNSYWKLYAIENYLRVIMHSILFAQVPAPWWENAVNPKLKEKVAVVKANHAVTLTHTSAGHHDIYYAFLPDLNKIIAANSNLFREVIPDIDAWLPRIEDIRIPRNLIGHMNFPSAADRKRIDKLYVELTDLVRKLEKSALTIKIP